MKQWIRTGAVVAACAAWPAAAARAQSAPAQTAPAQTAPAPTVADEYKPQVGQAGKDVVWVPSDETMVEKMLDMAAVTSQDFVVDLGSGDGRNVIAAAKRGARALGVEYNPEMVELSRRNAARAGVGDRATFVQGDMFEADFSKATVLALFLLPDNLSKLKDKFLNLRPGTRIVGNTFGIEGWEPDVKDQVGGECTTWCTALMWIVPAKVGGTWRTPAGELTLTQQYQTFTGTLTSGTGSAQVEQGTLRGDEIKFTAGGIEYAGRVTDSGINGTMTQAGKTTAWRATRQ